MSLTDGPSTVTSVTFSSAPARGGDGERDRHPGSLADEAVPMRSEAERELEAELQEEIRVVVDGGRKGRIQGRRRVLLAAIGAALLIGLATIASGVGARNGRTEVSEPAGAVASKAVGSSATAGAPQRRQRARAAARARRRAALRAKREAARRRASRQERQQQERRQRGEQTETETSRAPKAPGQENQAPLVAAAQGSEAPAEAAPEGTEVATTTAAPASPSQAPVEQEFSFER